VRPGNGTIGKVRAAASPKPGMTIRPLPQLVASWPSAAALASGIPQLFCPWLAGFDPAIAFWLGALPWHDANASLFGAPRRVRAVPPTLYAGVFCIDPFRLMTDLHAALRGAGIGGIVNLPSVSVFDGEFGSLLTDFDLGIEREIAFLRQARAAGFRIAGCAPSAEAARALADAGADFVIAHGGAPQPRAPDPSIAAAQRLRRALAASGVQVFAIGEILAAAAKERGNHYDS
jgi:hypothetical protein